MYKNNENVYSNISKVYGGNYTAETKHQVKTSLSGESIKECSAIAGILPPLYLIVKRFFIK